jgi:hypothetical protein
MGIYSFAIGPDFGVVSEARTLRNGRICQSMAGFWGGTHFVSDLSSVILRLGVQRLTHRSASNKKTATRVDPVWGLTGVAVGYGPLNLVTYSLSRYAISVCAELDGVLPISAICSENVRREAAPGLQLSRAALGRY